jgi:uncharacterized protein (TIGR02453 family)
MASEGAIFTQETFRFFRDLARHNHKDWMDANRERYRECVVAPFRQLLDALTPAVLALDPYFDVSGRTGANFSRINRDIRFAKDKTPYRTQMYLQFRGSSPKTKEAGQLYVGLSSDTVSAGFRIYGGQPRKLSPLAQIAAPRVLANPRWVAQQKKRLGRRYESYWYSMEKGEWTRHDGWPETPEPWKRMLGWIVRRKMPPSAATRAAFPAEAARVFRELFPIYRLTSLPD